MPGKRFFDTRILIYAFACGDPRCALAESLLAEGGLISVQVLNELLGPARPLTAAVHANAVVLARDQKLSFYDALIVSAALDAGCQSLITEDMQHGQNFGALTIENPFRR